MNSAYDYADGGAEAKADECGGQENEKRRLDNVREPCVILITAWIQVQGPAVEGIDRLRIQGLYFVSRQVGLVLDAADGEGVRPQSRADDQTADEVIDVIH